MLIAFHPRGRQIRFIDGDAVLHKHDDRMSVRILIIPVPRILGQLTNPYLRGIQEIPGTLDVPSPERRFIRDRRHFGEGFRLPEFFVGPEMDFHGGHQSRRRTGGQVSLVLGVSGGFYCRDRRIPLQLFERIGAEIHGSSGSVET